MYGLHTLSGRDCKRLRGVLMGASLAVAGAACGGDSKATHDESTATSLLPDAGGGTGTFGDVDATIGSLDDDTGTDSTICTGHGLKSWCFELVEVGVGGQLVDFDGDEFTDVIKRDFAGSSLQGFAGRGAVAAWFEQVWTVESEFDALVYRALDVEDDGTMELLLTSWNSLESAIELYRSDGTDAPVPIQTFDEPRNWIVGRIVTARIDDDDLLDVVVLPEGYPWVQVWLGHPTEDFVPLPQVELEDDVYGRQNSDVADVDGDGWIDLIVQESSTVNPAVYFGDGAGGFGEVERIGDAAPGHTYARDVDGDGMADIIFGFTNGFKVAYSEGRSFRTVVHEVGVEPSVSGEYFQFLPIDLEGNGALDLVGFHEDVVGFDDSGDAIREASLHVFSEAGTEGFSEHSWVRFELDCEQGADVYEPRGPLELDGDGNPDVQFGWTHLCGEATVHGLLYRP